MQTRWIAGLMVATLSTGVLAQTDGKVKVQRVSPNHTAITIHDNPRPAPARPAAAQPSFQEVDLKPQAASPTIIIIQQQPAAAQPQAPQGPVQSYTQLYGPGPNTGMANNGFFTPGGSGILSTGPIYGWGYNGWGYGTGFGFNNGFVGGGSCGGYLYPGYYTPFYANQNVINQPIQRLNPPPGTHPASIFQPAPQSFQNPIYVPGGGCRRY